MAYKVYMNLYLEANLRNALDRLAKEERTSRSALCVYLLRHMLELLGELEPSRVCAPSDPAKNNPP